jgi:hypothetical protein
MALVGIERFVTWNERFLAALGMTTFGACAPGWMDEESCVDAKKTGASHRLDYS